jgi:excisionase family DNA binding protein
MTNNTICPAPIFLRPRDAAQKLAVSERTLWSMTVPRGPIPAAKIGRAVRYRLADLEAFAAQAAHENGRA